MTASDLLAPVVVIAVFALILWRARRYDVHVPHPEFRQRFTKLPKVEGSTRERFR